MISSILPDSFLAQRLHDTLVNLGLRSSDATAGMQTMTEKQKAQLLNTLHKVG